MNSNDLEKYHETLNRKDILPNKYLRRNHKSYPVVCYVNNIICLYISKNYEEIPLMISRANTYMLRFSDEEKKQIYFRTVIEYISMMKEFISTKE